MTHNVLQADIWDATGVVAEGHLQYALINSFTSSPYSGNPAAVVMLAAPMTDAWMRHVAREFNVSETSFLLPLATPDPAAPSRTPVGPGQGDDHQQLEGARDYSLRWFTPNGTEVSLCGHATLAAAHVLIGRDRSLCVPDAGACCVRFHTLSGLLIARAAPSGGGAIELDFPMHEGAPAEEARSRLQGAFPQLEMLSVSKSTLDDFMVVCPSEQAVRELHVDWAQLRAIGDCRGVTLTARDAPCEAGAATNGTHDFVQRFFAPNAGIDEDPVTGSAFCTTGPYWADRLQRDTLCGFQASTRGGFVEVQVDTASRRCRLRGEAVATMCGFLLHHADTK
eukprot:jgi/Mesvir1/26600/Mv09570-RA.1